MNSLDQTFSALGDATRRAILARLTDGEVALSELAAPLPMSQSAVSKHVRVLSNAGLVSVSKRGRTRYCRLQPAPMQQASDWLADYQRFWQHSFSALAAYLDKRP